MEDIAEALRQRGYDALGAAEAGMLERPDSEQLEYAASVGRAILTYNSHDYALLAGKWFEEGRVHSGIILSQQFSKREFGELLRQTLRLLNVLTRDEMRNQVFYLQAFR
ncbi:MAG: DUF5615 family PIN-like protein [Chloroflexi bacterium]|nr:DUF5615 family PIN-like protein [Chloroflexota bacterium]